MLILRFAASIYSVGLMMLNADLGLAQTFPNRPIRIVTTDAGGNGDFHARLVAQGISGPLGQPVVVENKGGTVLAAQTAAKSTPDGYTLFTTGTSFWIGALLQQVPYDPVKDFSPVILATNSPSVLSVYPAVPIKSVKDLIALAKAKPGALNYAAAAPGSSNHLAGELFKAMAGVDIVAIPYKAAGPALNDVIGGQVQMIFGSAAAVAPHIKSGKLRAVAVTSTQASALFPGLPTVAETVPDYASGSMIGLFAPVGTPVALINRLNQEIVRVLNRSDVKEKLFSSGIEVVASSPAQFGDTLKSEMARMGKVIKDAGIRAE